MKVKELVEQLNRVNPEARVHLGYDGNVVCEEASEVEEVKEENQIGSCWYSVNVGDVVILCA